YDANWPIWKWVEEATNTKLTISTIPMTDLQTKLPLLLSAKDTLPDLLHMNDLASVNQNTASGAFVSITDSMDKMPNYKKFLDGLPEAERKELIMQRTSGDGKQYYPVVYGAQTVLNLRSWMYRKDIFEKNNLQAPKNLDEMYQVARKLKKIYPESYPLAFRQGLEQLRVMGPMWKPYFDWQVYYDFDAKKWNYGATDKEVMTQIITFFTKMSNEKLIPPDFTSINVNSWQELVTTNRGFMMPEYLIRIDFFNKMCRKDNPDYTWAIMDPPASNSPTGQQKIAKINMDPTGYVICNTEKTDRIDRATKFVDWMYSPEGVDLLSWGKKGESYEEKDGKKKFIIDESKGEAVQSKYGIGTYGVYQWTTSFENLYSDEQVEQGHIAYKRTEDYVNPVLWLALNKEEMRTFQEYDQALKSYCEQNIANFLIGKKPLSELDAFQKTLKEMGTDKLLSAYESAYNRATSNVK
ncbi:MAG: extracellular solute-binding protein, partial [Clostridia bacterium]